MNLIDYIENDTEIRIDSERYYFTFDKQENCARIFSKASNALVLDFPIHSTVDALREKEFPSQLTFVGTTRLHDAVTLEFEAESNLWKRKRYFFICDSGCIQYYCLLEGKNKRIDDINLLMHREEDEKGATVGFASVYVPRFDWSAGKVHIRPDQQDTLGCQQWLSPPPFCYAFEMGGEWVSCGLAVKSGEYNFLSYDYHGGARFYLTLTYEAHTIVNGEFETPHLIFGFGEREENASVRAYIQWLYDNKYLQQKTKRIPAWWKEPIFCGWGQMRYDYRRDHGGQENGNFINVCDYATELIYREYDSLMEKNGVNPGTIIIDAGWAESASYATPNPRKWLDMRKWIDEQHQKGRKVLLWFSPLIAEGLPKEACITLCGNVIASDPTSPEYRKIVANEIEKMLSDAPGCLDVDGFKIDFTQNVPSERGVFRDKLYSIWALIAEVVRQDDKYLYESLDQREELIHTHGNQWGVELLKEYIQFIYENMKKVKPDSVLITHTANPYFADIVDILRLNDLDGESSDVLGIMRNRAEIARMCNPDWLIDTENDLMTSKEMWRKYIQLQPQLGIPDNHYLSAIAATSELFDEQDYALLRQVWDEYRENTIK